MNCRIAVSDFECAVGQEAGVMLWVEPQQMLFGRWGYPLRGRRLDKHLIIQSSTYTMETHKHMFIHIVYSTGFTPSSIAGVLFTCHLISPDKYYAQCTVYNGINSVTSTVGMYCINVPPHATAACYILAFT